MKKSKYIILALSYVIVHILLILSILDSNNPLNASIEKVYLMGIPEYLAFALYPIDFSSKKDASAWFIIFLSIIGCITTVIYGGLAIFFITLISVYSNLTPNISGILPFSIIVGNILLSPCLAIDAHINKRHIEKYFHLFYMMFMPILPLLLANIAAYPIIVAFGTLIVIIVIFTPFFFTFRNYYLWYRRYRNNPMKLDTSKTLQLQFNQTTEISKNIKFGILLLTMGIIFFMPPLITIWFEPIFLIYGVHLLSF